MTHAATDIDHNVTPLRDLWESRIRRSVVQMFAALMLAVGFHLVFAERYNGFELGAQIVLMEVVLVLAANPRGDATSPATQAWLRRGGLRALVYGALLAVAAAAGIAQFSPPMPKPLLILLLAAFGLGGFVVIVGGSMFYWSLTWVRQWNVRARPRPWIFALASSALALASVYATVSRAQRSGAIEPLRVVGVALVIAAIVLAVMNPPEWMSDSTQRDGAREEII